MSNSLICSEKWFNKDFNKSTSNKEKRALIQQQYLSGKTNHLICINVTTLHKKNNHHVFCAIDVASRCVIGHCFLDRKICVTDVIKTLYQILKDRDFLPNVEIVDSDRGSLSKNQAYIELFEKQGIKVSKAFTKEDVNNIIKRFFRTFKEYIKKKLNLSLHNKNIDLNHFKNFKEKAHFIQQVIESYNKKPHKSLYGISPNTMEEGLHLHYKGGNIVDDDIMPALILNDNSKVAKSVKIYQEMALQAISENPKQWLVGFREETKTGFNEILQLYLTLYNQNLELKKTLHFRQKSFTERLDNIEQNLLEINKQINKQDQLILDLVSQIDDKMCKK